MIINKFSSHPSTSAIVTIFVADYPVQRGLHPSHQLTESDIHESQLAEQIGLKWKDLARELGFLRSTIDMIENEKLSISFIFNFWSQDMSRDHNYTLRHKKTSRFTCGEKFILF